ncbi:DNA polymerase IV [Nocardioides marmoriginsengisoli]|uniref:DNA polymerase IV n=2 Tax=Nocardioides marmoriginsengisoli TaxID=661483 RepID=A0A3N0CRF2_9ACTN|nr:DNA polymerase IV [Nocardioides marmoriginsengisoli]
MDAFYASVMLRDRPELRDVPVVIGGGHRGVVLAANYPARAFGVRSGMSGTDARRLCPQAVRLAPDYVDFEAVSRSVMETFRQVTPLVEAYSLDEAFLDVRAVRRSQGTPLQVAEWLRATIFDEQRITCSVGLAGTVSVAKLASRRAKPDGVLMVPPDRVVDYLHPLDVGELFGVGPKTRAKLLRIGLVTVGDVARIPLPTLQQMLGSATGRHLHELAWGTDRSTLTPRRSDDDPERSMGAEETFSRDTADPAVISRELLRLSGKVTARMRAAGLAGRTVAIRIRYSNFETITRSRSLPDPTDVSTVVHTEAVRLFTALGTQRRIRLVGVRVEGLRSRVGVDRQLALGERDRGWREADRAVDQAGRRFGRGTVRPATLIRSDRP